MLRLDEAGEVRRVGGVRWTIRDGVANHAPALLEHVARMVAVAEPAVAGGAAAAERGR